MATGEPDPKRRISEECIINRLPDDLIEQIFLSLPVSTLLRCVGVCKRWLNFIRDPEFVATQLRHAHRYALIFFPQGLVSGKPYPSEGILIDETWSPSVYVLPVIGPDDYLFGSCNGLLALYTNTSTIKIANLATRECLYLEKPAKNARGHHYSFYSFGFHPVTKEYKITHFLADSVEGCPSYKHFSVIQVYTLGGEKWRDIPTPEPLSLDSVRTSGVVSVDGTVYWLTRDNTASWRHAVMSFDLSDESFTMIQLPADYLGPHRLLIRDIDGKLCIVTAQTDRDNFKILLGELHIWTLDSPVEQRWSRKYNIKNPPVYIPGPHLGHRGRILTQSNFRVGSYELIGENFGYSFTKTAMLLDVSPRRLYNMQSYICVKSLVCLDAYKKVGIVRKPKQQLGWQSKKWEAWENERCEVEKLRTNVHKEEHDLSELAERVVKMYQVLVDKPLAISERVRTELNWVLHHKPEKPYQPRFLRRLNWVEQKRDKEELVLRSYKMNIGIQAISQAQDNISSIVRSYTSEQGVSTSGVSSTHDKNKKENLPCNT
ncbi:hypothetical protein QYE76_005996 [Lolium multiflorum]|uniref:F-box domain-containing protein n=1 Tax=Lolium multiflorum TaxID=4521 RepID=A0AAD8W400_LOLMU|nr:hypothetical protein QYE76_005996 [Lolium multiflorum]